jgi:hypothetical protein
MITIDYIPCGYALSDSEIQKIIDRLCTRKDYFLNTSNELFILACRAAVKTGKLDYKNIQFLFDGIQFRVNEFGNFTESPPPVFSDNHNRYLDILLGI